MFLMISVDVHWRMVVPYSPEVNNHFLCFAHVQAQVVGFAPVRQAQHLFVCCLVVLADETHHGCVIAEPDYVI